jgi:hypothetical protein
MNIEIKLPTIRKQDAHDRALAELEAKGDYAYHFACGSSNSQLICIATEPIGFDTWHALGAAQNAALGMSSGLLFHSSRHDAHWNFMVGNSE